MSARGTNTLAGVLRPGGALSLLVAQRHAAVIARAMAGHFGQARYRLRMLLCLDPHDGPARLLLAKVFAAQGRYPDALSQLDAARSCGVGPEPELRGRIEEAILSAVPELDITAD